MKFSGSFGPWLKGQRKALDLTQHDLAQQVACSVATIRKIEQNAGRPSKQITQLLADVLAISVEDRGRFIAFARRSVNDFVEPSTQPVIQHHLRQQSTPFVGRARELAQIAERLGDPNCRLLTVVGSGGIGKTRLALEAAAQHTDDFADGVHFVPFAPINVPELMASTIASVLEISLNGPQDPQTQLVNTLRQKQALLVLDNLEHLLDGIGLLMELLANAPQVKIVATSRERLNLQEEWLLPLDGLSYPEQVIKVEAESYDAVRLFAQNARRVQPNFALSNNLAAVIETCRAVEGMPLGLELAAAWLRTMSCSQVPIQIRRDLDFLTTPLRNVPERHRSLRAVFDHSWKLLSNIEQLVLAKLTIFRGGFDQEAAEQVAGASLTILAGLVDKSMIRLDTTGRYDLHELLRQFAAERLSEADQLTLARQHFAYFLGLAEQSDPHLFYGGPYKIGWLKRLKPEHYNLQVALAWSLDGTDPLQSLQLAAALRWYWLSNHQYREGWQWLGRILAKNPTGPLVLRAKVLHAAGSIANHYPGDFKKSVALCEEALMLACDANDETMIGWTLATLGLQVPVFLGGSSGIALSEAAEAIFREIGDKAGLSDALIAQAVYLRWQHNYERAVIRLEEALALNREIGEPTMTAWTLHHMSGMTWHQGDIPRTKDLSEEAMRLFQEINDLGGQAYCTLRFGDLARASEDYHQAEFYYVKALIQFQELGANGNAAEVLTHLGRLEAVRHLPAQAAVLLGAAANDPWRDTANSQFITDVAIARADLGDTAFELAYAKGKMMGLEQAVAYAIEQHNIDR